MPQLTLCPRHNASVPLTDGCSSLLITTRQAAYGLGTTPAGFRGWARRRGIIPAAYQPTGRAGHPEALWGPADIAGAVRRGQGAA